MISLDRVAARRAPLSLSDLSVSWGPGGHALVGASRDGGPLLLAVLAGAARIRSGRARVLEHPPGDPAIRPRVAFVPLDPCLPEALRVDETLRLASALRGEEPQNAVERLRVLGVEALAPRRSRSLSHEEARAVALVEAITSARVEVLLIEEPLVAVDPRAATRVSELLRARARAGSTVIVATASVRDAVEIADDYVMLSRGTTIARASSLEALVAFSPNGARLRIAADDPRALQAALGQEQAVEAIARTDGTLVARGRDPIALARAVGRAAVAAGVEVTEMRLELPSLEDARPTSGLAAHENGKARGRSSALVATDSSPSPPPGAKSS
ncbi:MAG: hypothetical protein M3O50_19265 [Myxococcota bacterium]|nr:hypothetical protein [Myxococcota bacterium]